MTHVGSTSSGIDGNSISPESIVSEIVSALSDVMGKEVLTAMAYGFKKVSGISFEDNYIFDNPDKFAVSLKYAFGAGGDVLLRLINARLARKMRLENAKELIDWGEPGFIFIINTAKKNMSV
jgi:hypothetical protein